MGRGEEEEGVREAPLYGPGCPHISCSATSLSPSWPRRELRGQEPAGPSVQEGAHGVHKCTAGGAGKGIPLQPLLVPATPRGDGQPAEPHRAADQDLVPEPAHEVEKRPQVAQHQDPLGRHRRLSRRAPWPAQRRPPCALEPPLREPRTSGRGWVASSRVVGGDEGGDPGAWARKSLPALPPLCLFTRINAEEGGGEALFIEMTIGSRVRPPRSKVQVSCFLP